MANEDDSWTYEFRIRGVRSPRDVPLADLGSYLTGVAELLGDRQSVKYGGLVKGSALLRVRVDPDKRSSAQMRVHEAKIVRESDAARAARSLQDKLTKDGLDATLSDRSGVVLDFRKAVIEPDRSPEISIRDVGVLDGIVVGLTGADDTLHVRLQDVDGSFYNASTRDIELARQLGARFRRGPVRLNVDGRWLRTADGRWVPEQVRILSYEDLTDETVAEAFEKLRLLPANGWANEEDPIKAWEEMRE